MFEVQGVLACDRCVRERACGSTDEDAVREAAASEGWAEDEDGNDVCPACWAKWDDAQPVALTREKG